MNKKLIINLAAVVVIIFIALFSDKIAPNDPYDNNIARRLEYSSKEYPLGTDELGRCIYSRLIYGTRNTLEIAGCVIGISALLGASFGCISGYKGGIVDRVLINIFDLFMAFPPFVYVMVLMGIFGTGKINLILSMTIYTWVISTKLVRSKVKIEKEKDYVKSARVFGTSSFKIVTKHIIPNIIRPLVVFFSTQIGDIILMISGFSFLGLGMSGDIPEWGMMISTAKNNIYANPMLMVYPGICIFIAVYTFNSLAENIKEKVEVKG